MSKIHHTKTWRAACVQARGSKKSAGKMPIARYVYLKRERNVSAKMFLRNGKFVQDGSIPFRNNNSIYRKLFTERTLPPPPTPSKKSVT